LLTGEFYSKGKFLLTGEYLVLHGAKALAVPLKFGQTMMVRETERPGILLWETYVTGNLWFTGVFGLSDMEILDTSDRKIALFIQNLLIAGSKYNPELMESLQGYHIRNSIDFNIKWGLGSSSSLISNMAWWLEISPFTLFHELFQGSGFDIACSRADKPIVYQLNNSLPVFMEINFNPSFSEKIYFIYSGKKQDSQQSVLKFRQQFKKDNLLTREISDATEALIQSRTLEEFSMILELHENLLSLVLGLPKVKDELFPDFPGAVKSLGAWGGDFVMASANLGYEEVKDYFSRKNLPVVFRWKEIVL
jgi:mevalonate kinase